MESTRDLSNVMFLLTFLLIGFSITGMLFWNGLLHARCRLTPFPVFLSDNCKNVENDCWNEYIQNISTAPQDYRCLPNDNDDRRWTQSSSPWFVQGPQDCIWPIDNDDERICSLGKGGKHKCAPIYQTDGRISERTCGSNFDSFGNPRFIDSTEPYGYPRMKSGTFIEGLNWGFTNYDSFLPAFLTTFQSITLEGWTDIMYQVIDSWAFAPTVAIFCTQVILCGYIVLNLVLAVISKSLDEFDEESSKERNDLSIIPEDQDFHEEENDSHGDEAAEELEGCLEKAMSSQSHSAIIMACIVLNTIVLSIDHYGISDNIAAVLENLNSFFSIVFIFDVIVCNVAFGPKVYWR